MGRCQAAAAAALVPGCMLQPEPDATCMRRQGPGGGRPLPRHPHRTHPRPIPPPPLPGRAHGPALQGDLPQRRGPRQAPGRLRPLPKVQVRLCPRCVCAQQWWWWRWRWLVVVCAQAAACSSSLTRFRGRAGRHAFGRRVTALAVVTSIHRPPTTLIACASPVLRRLSPLGLPAAALAGTSWVTPAGRSRLCAI